MLQILKRKLSTKNMQKYKVDFINSGYRRWWKKRRKDVLKAIDDCGKRGDYVMRKDLLEFEGKLAEYTGTKYAVGVNSGTDALRLALEALDITGNYYYLHRLWKLGKITKEEMHARFEGDEVITVSHTFIASIQVIAQAGARPVLIDVGEDGLMNPDLIEAAITPRTKAIMPIHLSGKICDMTKILEIANRRGLSVIEDACQAMGAVQKVTSEFAGVGAKRELKAGAIGMMGCFSFISPKLMGGFGDNGAITTDSRELYEKLLLLRNHWNITQGALHGHQPETPKVMDWGWNSRMDNVQAAALNVKFQDYPWILERRKQIAMMYNDGLKDLPIKLPIQQEGQVYQEFIIRVENQAPFVQFMADKGVELLIRDLTPNHKLEGYALDHFSLPVTEAMASAVVRLPTYPQLKDKEVQYVIKTIRKYFKK